ncbi:MAG: zf-HC2 domain-containing protein, partial [Planctomycetales bacterium]|nr:zf-HC2 domain-containing protein [Planctomycetales bacterium]
MSCAEVREKIQDLLDERLAGAERESLANHLAGCAACSAEREALRATRDLLRAHGAVKAPAALAPAVAAAIRADLAARARPRILKLGRPGPILTTFAVAASVLVLALLVRDVPPPAPAPGGAAQASRPAAAAEPVLEESARAREVLAVEKKPKADQAAGSDAPEDAISPRKDAAGAKLGKALERDAEIQDRMKAEGKEAAGAEELEKRVEESRQGLDKAPGEPAPITPAESAPAPAAPAPAPPPAAEAPAAPADLKEKAREPAAQPDEDDGIGGRLRGAAGRRAAGGGTGGTRGGAPPAVRTVRVVARLDPNDPRAEQVRKLLRDLAGTPQSESATAAVPTAPSGPAAPGAAGRATGGPAPRPAAGAAPRPASPPPARRPADPKREPPAVVVGESDYVRFQRALDAWAIAATFQDPETRLGLVEAGEAKDEAGDPAQAAPAAAAAP